MEPQGGERWCVLPPSSPSCGFPCGCTTRESPEPSPCITFLRSVYILTQERKKKKSRLPEFFKAAQIIAFLYPSVSPGEAETPGQSCQPFLRSCSLSPHPPARLCCLPRNSLSSQLQCPLISLLFYLLAGVGCERHQSLGLEETQQQGHGISAVSCQDHAGTPKVLCFPVHTPTPCLCGGFSTAPPKTSNSSRVSA